MKKLILTEDQKLHQSDENENMFKKITVLENEPGKNIFPLHPLFSLLIKIRNKYLFMVLIAFVPGMFSTASGQEPDRRSVKARKNLKDAKEEVRNAKRDSIAEFNNFKKEANEKISAHKKSIADFKVRIAKQKKENKIQYEKDLVRLEKKNSDLKKKLDDFKEAGKDTWVAFKKAYNDDMYELEKEMKGISKDLNKN